MYHKQLASIIKRKSNIRINLSIIGEYAVWVINYLY